MLGEYKDFVYGYGIKPSLDPAPDGRKEGGSTNDLAVRLRISSVLVLVLSKENALTNIASKVSG